ncbi:MAG: gliding motility-associated C-terminal domain-containing protein [Bacteroidota bacterium]
MKKLKLFFIGMLFPFWASTQLINLVPNGNFEEIECPDNLIPSIYTTSTWYALNSDAYWLHDDCEYPEEAIRAIYAVDPDISPYDGKGYMSLEFVVLRSGHFVSEGIGIELTEKLKAGKNYYFEMTTIQLGFEKAFDHPIYFCNIPTDPLDMDVYVSDERIEIGFTDTIVDLNSFKNRRFSNAEKVMSDTSFRSAEYKNRDWILNWNTFNAKGYETHLAVANQNKEVEDVSSCMGLYVPGALQFNSFGVDAIKLFELPDRIDTLTTICDDGGWVDIENIVPHPIFDKATYTWDDGCTDTRRLIRQDGIYFITMKINDIIIPISLSVEFASSCNAVTYDEDLPEKIDTSFFFCPDEAVQFIQMDSLIPKWMLGQTQYEWQDGSTVSNRPIISADDLFVIASTDCFDFPINIEVTERACQTNVFVPSAFSPNNDGINDELRPFIKSDWNFRSYHFKIFDRWGQLVFQTQNPSDAWNGMNRGQLANSGVYIWMVEYELLDDKNSSIRSSGEVVLLK